MILWVPVFQLTQSHPNLARKYAHGLFFPAWRRQFIDHREFRFEPSEFLLQVLLLCPRKGVFFLLQVLASVFREVILLLVYCNLFCQSIGVTLNNRVFVHFWLVWDRSNDFRGFWFIRRVLIVETALTWDFGRRALTIRWLTTFIRPANSQFLDSHLYRTLAWLVWCYGFFHFFFCLHHQTIALLILLSSLKWSWVYFFMLEKSHLIFGVGVLALTRVFPAAAFTSFTGWRMGPEREFASLGLQSIHSGTLSRRVFLFFFDLGLVFSLLFRTADVAESWWHFFACTRFLIRTFTIAVSVTILREIKVDHDAPTALKFNVPV